MKKDIQDIIAPAAIEITANYIRLGNKLAKTFFIFTYPRYLSTGWFSPVINMPKLLDISIYINPIETPLALKNLRRKAAQVEAQINENSEKGLVRNPALETALQDIESLRDSLQQAQENMFSVGVYITIYGDDVKSLTDAET